MNTLYALMSLIGFYIITYLYLLRPINTTEFNSFLFKVVKFQLELFSTVLFMPIVRTVLKYPSIITQLPKLLRATAGSLQNSSWVPRTQTIGDHHSGVLYAAGGVYYCAYAADCHQVLVSGWSRKENHQD